MAILAMTSHGQDAPATANDTTTCLRTLTLLASSFSIGNELMNVYLPSSIANCRVLPNPPTCSSSKMEALLTFQTL